MLHSFKDITLDRYSNISNHVFRPYAIYYTNNMNIPTIVFIIEIFILLNTFRNNIIPNIFNTRQNKFFIFNSNFPILYHPILICITYTTSITVNNFIQLLTTLYNKNTHTPHLMHKLTHILFQILGPHYYYHFM